MSAEGPEHGALIDHWPAEWRPEVERKVAVSAFLLGLSTHEWVHRRVESIEFIDDERIRRRISVDFTLPEDPSELLEATTLRGRPATYVPLTMLRKRLLVNFDLHDEYGGSLPFLTRRQNNSVGATMLKLLAGVLLERPVPADVAADLEVIANGPGGVAFPVFDALRDPVPGSPSHTERTELSEHFRFMTLAEDLTNNYWLLVPIAAEPGARRIIKFSYEEQPGDQVARSAGQFITESLGWRNVPLLLPAPSVGAAGSYHCEIELPDDLEVETIRGVDLRADAELPDPMGLSEQQSYRGLRRVHVHYGGLPRATWGLVELNVGVARRGLLGAAFGSALVTAIVLSVESARIQELREAAEISTTILLAIPGLISSYILRPGEHPLVSKLFAGLRGTVLLSALCALSAAGALAVQASEEALSTLFAISLPVAWLCVVMILLSLLLPLDRWRVKYLLRGGGGARRAGAVRFADRLISGVRKTGRRLSTTRPPADVGDAIASSSLDLHGIPVETAEGWRAGFEGMDEENAVARTLELAERMNALR